MLRTIKCYRTKIGNRHFFLHQYPSGCRIMHTWDTLSVPLRVIIRRNRHSIVSIIIWAFLKTPLIPGCGAIVLYLYILLLRNITPVPAGYGPYNVWSWSDINGSNYIAQWLDARPEIVSRPFRPDLIIIIIIIIIWYYIESHNIIYYIIYTALVNRRIILRAHEARRNI